MQTFTRAMHCGFSPVSNLMHTTPTDAIYHRPSHRCNDCASDKMPIPSKTHERNKSKCPAFGKKCSKCGKENHFAAKCKTKNENGQKYKSVHAVAEQDSDGYEDIMTITVANEKKRDSEPNGRQSLTREAALCRNAH